MVASKDDAHIRPYCRLLKGRADPLAIDGFLMESAIHHAAREGHADVVRTLMGSAPRPQKGSDEEEDRPMTDMTEALRALAGTFGSGITGISGLKAQSLDEGNFRGSLWILVAHGQSERNCMCIDENHEFV